MTTARETREETCMAYQHQGSCASAGDTLELLAFDDEFDPLAVDDSEIDQEWMDDENPYDTIDYPTMRNMPETVHHDPVYSPARQGSATEALQALIVRNPNRRPVLLNIIGLCEGGCPSSVISERVDEWQRDNWSVYAPMTLCRMLERAGALTLEMPTCPRSTRAPRRVWRTWRFARPWIRCGARLPRRWPCARSTSPARASARLCWVRRGALRRGVRGGYGSP